MTAPPCFGLHWSNEPATPADWYTLGASGARWVKCLAGTTSVPEVRALRDAGLRVIVRAEGEGIVHWEDVLALCHDYAGLVEVLEVGNEPGPSAAGLWIHCWYLDAVWSHCADAARAGGMRLCTPGWQTDRWLTDADLPPMLQARLLAVYGQYPLIGRHRYGAWQLDPLTDLAPWPDKEIVLSEFGLAGPLPPDDKAARYAGFVRGLPAQVLAACAFLVGGSDEYNADLMHYRIDPPLGRALGAALG